MNARISSLTDYMARLIADQEAHVRNVEASTHRAVEAAVALDAISDSPAPWLALRDRITNDIADQRIARQAAETGVKAWDWVRKSETLVASLQAQVAPIPTAKEDPT